MHGAADLGVVGLDVLEEKEYDLIKLFRFTTKSVKLLFGLRAGNNLIFSKSKITVAYKT